MYILLLLVLASATAANAQKMWYVAPSSGVAINNANSDVKSSVSITVGRYFGANGNQRADFLAEVFFANQTSDWIAIAALLSYENPIRLFNLDRLSNTASLGLGMLSSKTKSWRRQNHYDIIVPFKFRMEYGITNFFSLGVDLSSHFNLNAFRSRTLFSVGVVAGFRF